MESACTMYIPGSGISKKKDPGEKEDNCSKGMSPDEKSTLISSYFNVSCCYCTNVAHYINRETFPSVGKQLHNHSYIEWNLHVQCIYLTPVFHKNRILEKKKTIPIRLEINYL